MDDSTTAVLIVGIILVVGVGGLVACAWAWAWRGRTALVQEEAYQRLAEESGTAQRRTAFELTQIAEDVADMRTRLVEMERLLKDVG